MFTYFYICVLSYYIYLVCKFKVNNRHVFFSPCYYSYCHCCQGKKLAAMAAELLLANTAMLRVWKRLGGRKRGSSSRKKASKKRVYCSWGIEQFMLKYIKFNGSCGLLRKSGAKRETIWLALVIVGSNTASGPGNCFFPAQYGFPENALHCEVCSFVVDWFLDRVFLYCSLDRLCMWN